MAAVLEFGLSNAAVTADERTCVATTATDFSASSERREITGVGSTFWGFMQNSWEIPG